MKLCYSMSFLPQHIPSRLPRRASDWPLSAAGVGTACVYFKAPRHPSEEALLYLNGEGTGIVNNCCFPATVQPSYAPPGKALVSASTVGVPDMR